MVLSNPVRLRIHSRVWKRKALNTYNVKQDLGMLVVTEVVDTRDVELVSRYSTFCRSAPGTCRISACSANVEKQKSRCS